MEDIPTIVAIRGPFQGREHPVDRQTYTLGRGKDNSLQIAWDVSISRRHARIVRHAGLIWLEDLASINGTSLTTPDGKQIDLQPHEPHLLLSTATFSLGKFADFEVLGTVASSYEAHCVIEAQMDRWIQAMQIRIPMLPQEDRCELLSDCMQLSEQLQSAQQAADTLLIAAWGLQALSDTRAANTAQVPLLLTTLPPLPVDLPPHEALSRLLSLVNRLAAYLDDSEPKCTPEDSEASS